MAGQVDTTEPILASWTLHEVLRRHPGLLQTLIGVHPAFDKLRNPIIRRVQARLVTVEHVARIAGLEPDALVHTLNAAAGLAAPPHRSTEAQRAAAPSSETPLEQSDAAVESDVGTAVELDVRPMLAKGEEPFGAIVAAVARLPHGQALRLRSSFEPIPLYAVLSRRGFVHRSRQLGPNDWEIMLFRRPSSDEEEPASQSPEPSRVVCPPTAIPAAASTPPAATVTIDVSELEPPEPMVRILETLERLAPGQTLLVEHVRRPVYLYQRLDELGYAHATVEPAPGRVEIRIHKPETTESEEAQ